jgi:hypothetical protein
MYDCVEECSIHATNSRVPRMPHINASIIAGTKM